MHLSKFIFSCIISLTAISAFSRSAEGGKHTSSQVHANLDTGAATPIFEPSGERNVQWPRLCHEQPTDATLCHDRWILRADRRLSGHANTTKQTTPVRRCRNSVVKGLMNALYSVHSLINPLTAISAFSRSAEGGKHTRLCRFTRTSTLALLHRFFSRPVKGMFNGRDYVMNSLPMPHYAMIDEYWGPTVDCQAMLLLQNRQHKCCTVEIQ